MNIAIIFAGGRETRFSNDSIPKQFVYVNSKPIIIHTLDIFEKHDLIDKIYIAIHKDDIKVTTPRDIYMLETLLKYRKKEQNELFRCEK